MVFPDGCIFSARLRGDFCSDQVDTSNAAVQCRRGRMEMQQVGVDFNELRAQARRALYLNELTSSVRSYVSANVELPSVEGSQKKGSRREKQNSSSVRANTLVSVLYGRRRRSPGSAIDRGRISAGKSD